MLDKKRRSAQTGGKVKGSKLEMKPKATTEAEARLARISRRMAADTRVLASIKASESDLKGNRILSMDQVRERLKKRA